MAQTKEQGKRTVISQKVHVWRIVTKDIFHCGGVSTEAPQLKITDDKCPLSLEMLDYLRQTLLGGAP